MMWPIIFLIVFSVCLYCLGYCVAKINALNKFKTVMNEIQVKVMNSDFSDEYQHGHALGLLHAIDMIQESNMF